MNDIYPMIISNLIKIDDITSYRLVCKNWNKIIFELLNKYHYEYKFIDMTNFIQLTRQDKIDFINFTGSTIMNRIDQDIPQNIIDSNLSDYGNIIDLICTYSTHKNYKINYELRFRIKILLCFSKIIKEEIVNNLIIISNEKYYNFIFTSNIFFKTKYYNYRVEKEQYNFNLKYLFYQNYCKILQELPLYSYNS